MPLVKGSGKAAISKNISKLVKDEGMKRSQAVAIALQKSGKSRSAKKRGGGRG